MPVEATECFGGEVAVEGFGGEIAAVDFDGGIGGEIGMLVEAEEGCDGAVEVDFLAWRCRI